MKFVLIVAAIVLAGGVCSYSVAFSIMANAEYHTWDGDKYVVITTMPSRRWMYLPYDLVVARCITGRKVHYQDPQNLFSPFNSGTRDP